MFKMPPVEEVYETVVPRIGNFVLAFLFTISVLSLFGLLGFMVFVTYQFPILLLTLVPTFFVFILIEKGYIEP